MMEKNILTQREIVRRELQIYKDSFVDIDEKNIDLFNRKKKIFEEYDFNMPQTIFFIRDNYGNIIVGRKTISQYYLDHKLKSLNCSRITYNMILGILDESIYSNRKISIIYTPFTQEEKIRCFKKIIHNLKDYNVEYPYQFKFYDTNLEQTSKNVDWNVDDEMAKYLSIGESHIREYTIANLDSYKLNPTNIYDPACSTGEFLASLKKLYPLSTTIGHDMSEAMVKYSSSRVDQSYCCDAMNSPIKQDSIDLLVLRFLNGGVVDTKTANTLFNKLIKTVKNNGHILCIGHTPILINENNFKENQLSMLDRVGYDKKSESIFQYYLAKKR